MNTEKIYSTLKAFVVYRSKVVRYYFLYPFLRMFDVFPHVEPVEKTIEKLTKEKLSIARFGDGEMVLIWGVSLRFQKYDSHLAHRLQEILNSNKSNLLIGVDDFFRFYSDRTDRKNAFAKSFRIEYLWNIVKTFKRKDYSNTVISRPVTTFKDKDAAETFNGIKQLWDGKNLYVIEGEKTRCGVGNDLFSNSNSIKRILCPSTNAYSKYDEILKRCKSLIPLDAIVYIALGPTATVLAYDLAQIGYRALDLGHLDIEYEYMKRGSHGEKMLIPGKFVNEVKGGNLVDDSIVDNAYLESIICKIV